MIRKADREDSVRRDLRILIAASGLSKKEWARRHDISPATLSSMIHGHKQVSERVAALAGYKLVKRWVRK